MTLQEAIQTVHSAPPSLNVYYLDKNGTINVIQEVPTSSSMLVLVEEDIRIKNVQSPNWLTLGDETRDYGSYDIPNPLPFDHRSNLDKKKKKQIYDQYKRMYDAVVEQLTNYGEDSNQTFKIAEEATGAALSTTGVVLTIIFPPAGGLGLIGFAVAWGSGMQALYGIFRTYVAYSDQDFLKILDDDKRLKVYMQIVDLASLLFSIYGLKGLFIKINEARKVLQVSISKLNSAAKELELINMNLGQLQVKLSSSELDIARAIGNHEDVSQINLLRAKSSEIYKKIAELREESLELIENKIRIDNGLSRTSLIIQQLLLKATEYLNIFEYKKGVKQFFKDDLGSLLIQLASIFANLTEGHGVATGTLNELRKGESIIQDAYKYLKL